MNGILNWLLIVVGGLVVSFVATSFFLVSTFTPEEKAEFDARRKDAEATFDARRKDEEATRADDEIRIYNKKKQIEQEVEAGKELLAKYEILGAPKILYRCGNQVGYSAGVGVNATYNHIVIEAEKGCRQDFNILKKQQ